MIEATDKLALFHIRQRLAAALEVMASGRVSEARVMLQKLWAEVDVRVKEEKP